MADSQQSYMIVDGVLGDYVQEIAAYIDKLDPPASEDASFEKLATGLIEAESEENQEKIFKAIADKSIVLSKAPEKEFEPAYNLVLHILTFSSNLSDILPIVLSNLSQHPPASSVGSLQVLSVLANLFNILPTTSPLRHSVFDTLLTFADKTNNLHLLVGQLKQLPKWLNEWSVDESAKKDVFFKVSELLAGSSDLEQSYKFLVQAAQAVGIDEEGTVIAQKLVTFGLQSEFLYDFDEILGVEAVQKLASQDKALFEILSIYASGDFAAFKAFDRSSTAGLSDWETLEKKIKVLALTKLASLADDRTLSYQTIATTIEVSESEVELWVIDAIRAGLVEGRLSQIDQQFVIHRATPVGQFGAEHWNVIRSRLDTWKASLQDVLEVVRSSRENAQRDKIGRFRPRQGLAA